MLRKIFSFMLSLCLYTVILQSAESEDKKLIGIIMPIQHQALEDIATGFQEELAQFMGDQKNYEVRVMNAQGDLSVQMAIIQNLMRNNCQLFVPIGTATTQMTMQLLRNSERKILALAAHLPHAIQTEEGISPITGILDEVSLEQQLQFLQGLLPSLRKFTVVHSGSEKIHDELAKLRAYGQHHHLDIQFLMAQTMTDLASCTQSINSDTQCLFILKDHLIVSGIHLLIQRAAALQVPLIASDEGSVKAGAVVALGVREDQIGRDGAKLAAAILKGQSPREIPITRVETIQIFMNKKSCTRQMIDEQALHRLGEELHYQVVTCKQEE